jgi:hypothetical protein
VGTTAVSFDGVPATFQVLTVNYISITVPSGAKTGKIAVTNGGGTITSTKAFEIPQIPNRMGTVSGHRSVASS